MLIQNNLTWNKSRMLLAQFINHILHNLIVICFERIKLLKSLNLLRVIKYIQFNLHILKQLPISLLFCKHPKLFFTNFHIQFCEILISIRLNIQSRFTLIIVIFYLKYCQKFQKITFYLKYILMQKYASTLHFNQSMLLNNYPFKFIYDAQNLFLILSISIQLFT